jgi:hypothetical protein
LGEEVPNVIAAGADEIHFDMMGSHCVPGLTIGPLVCEALHPCATVPIDAHLMVGPVDRIIADFASAGGEYHDFRSGGRKHAERIAHRKPHPVSPTSLPCRARRLQRGRAGGQCRRRCASIPPVCRSPFKTSRTNDDTDYLERSARLASLAPLNSSARLLGALHQFARHPSFSRLPDD